jgi:hypothetical protein
MGDIMAFSHPEKALWLDLMPLFSAFPSST